MDSDLIAILRTLVYSDIFDYPLSLDELWKFLITDKPVDKKTIDRSLKRLEKKIVFKNGWYTLVGKGNNIEKRKKHQEVSQRKLVIAHRAAKLLSYIPTIACIGVSGSLAMKNADADADIDFLIIAQQNTVWLTRFLCLGILSFFGLRRKRDDPRPGNKICINMLIDTTQLRMPFDRQDLYTAHEIMQLQPLFERDSTYRQFLSANAWVKKFLANCVTPLDTSASLQKKVVLYMLYPFEVVARMLQMWNMRAYITNETVAHAFIAFHPVDNREKIIKAYEKRIRAYV